MVEILKEAFTGSLNSVISISMIVIPLMIVMELAKDYKILDKISNRLKFIIKPFQMSNGSTFPLLVGLIFGLSYGAGVILQGAKEGNLSKKDSTLIGIFLIACHAVFEDTLIFVAVGANGWLLLGARASLAFLITLVLSRTMKNNFLSDEQ